MGLAEFWDFESFISNSLRIYPNPSSKEVIIETPAEDHLSILNLNGQEIITRQIIDLKTQLDIADLPSGVYFVRLTKERTVGMGKFIKK